MCEICSKLIIRTPEQCHQRRSGVFIGNFEQILHIALVFLLFTLNKCWLGHEKISVKMSFVMFAILASVQKI